MMFGARVTRAPNLLEGSCVSALTSDWSAGVERARGDDDKAPQAPIFAWRVVCVLAIILGAIKWSDIALSFDNFLDSASLGSTF